MSIVFDRVGAGDRLYDARREHGRDCCWSVHVISIDLDAGTARVRWNGNDEQTFSRQDIERLRRSQPKARGGTR